VSILNSRGSRWLAAALLAAFLAGHLPFLASSLEDIDSVNFALGVERFDVADHRPHPPGYPLFVVLGKLGTAGARALAPDSPTETISARGLAIWGALLGALAVLPLLQVFFAIEGRATTSRAATALTLASPLFWFNASRPMSDVPGLFAGLCALALLATAFRRQRAAAAAAREGARAISPEELAASGQLIVAGALVAGLALGMRSQTMWLTLPVLVFVLVDRIGRGVAGALLGSTIALMFGASLWAIPMVVASGGPGQYLAALSSQAGEDFVGVDMLATNPSPRLLAFGLLRTFVEPWVSVPLAIAVLALATLGGAAVVRRSREAAALLAAIAMPYAVFHLLFQETQTTRYALPLVPAVAYLAARGLAALGRLALTGGTLALVAACLVLTVPALASYSADASPLSRAMTDLAARAQDEAGAPPLAMHHAFARALRGDPRVPLAAFAPPRQEVRQLARFLVDEGAGRVWFLADPRRADLVAIDPASMRVRGHYRWPFDADGFLGGVRPSSVDWLEMREPGWVAVAGWALSPELAGTARLEGAGPTREGAIAFVRARPEPAVALIGGRNLGRAGAPDVRFRLLVDGEPREEWSVRPDPGFFLTTVPLARGVLASPGRYVRLAIVAEAADGSGAPVEASVEQFDLQAPGTVMFGYDAGWHEPEYSPATGRQWRWSSDEAQIRVLHATADLEVTIAGESPLRYFEEPPEVVLRAGAREVGRIRPDRDFVWRVYVSAEAVREAGGVLTLSTDRVFVPDERTGHGDRRRLGLRIFDVEVAPAPGAARDGSPSAAGSR
jgi:hypothetical protein